MSIKQTIRNVTAGFFLLFGFALLIAPITVSAAPDTNNGCEANTAIIKCSDVVTDGTGNERNTGLWSVLILVINLLTAGVGTLALGGIVYGAILYTTAGGSQEQVKKATTIFTNVVIGIIAFAAMWALLNFLVPGGVFKQ